MVLLLTGASPSHAHNGAIAVAYPAGGIAVDGDVGDWPDALPRYPIALPEYGDRPASQTDCDGWFRVAHDPATGEVCLAVEVRDESVVLDTSAAPPWNAGDGCEVYVQPTHEARHAPPRQYWVRSRSQGQGSARRLPDGVAVGVRLAPGQRTYEWRIRLGAAQAGSDPSARVIGVDVAVLDRDQDGSFSWISWGRGSGKWAAPGNVGDVILLADALRAAADSLRARQFERTLEGIRNTSRLTASGQTLLTVAPLIVALLHLGLFLYYPQQRRNLYYAAFTAAAAVFLFSEYQRWSWNWAGTDYRFLDDWTTVQVVSYLICLGSLLGFLYSQFYERLPRQFWVFLAVAVGCLGLGIAYRGSARVAFGKDNYEYVHHVEFRHLGDFESDRLQGSEVCRRIEEAYAAELFTESRWEFLEVVPAGHHQ
ncbi:MAG: sugar-binding protein [Candidatus Latescibacterota bacterium]